MQPLAIALAAIGGLAVVAGLGWWAFSRSRKRVGELEEENRQLRGALDARNAQDAAFDAERGNDLRSDRDFLPDAD